MKKIILSAAVAAVCAGSLMSCGNSAPKANLKSDVDTLSYVIGMCQTNGLLPYLEQMGMDTLQMDQFIKGFNEAAKVGDNPAKKAYLMGLQIGQQVGGSMYDGFNRRIFGEDSLSKMDLNNYLAGFIAATTNKGKKFTMEEAQMVAQQMMESVKSKYMEKQYGDNKVAGEKFLAENAKKEGVKTLPSGLQYKVIKEGNGATPKDTSLVKVNYEGKTIDGKVFETTFDKQPSTLRANQVIKGWTEALTKMKEGDVWEVYIPQNLAYGSQDKRDIKPFSTLIFKIELLEANAKRPQGPQMRPGMGGPRPGMAPHKK